MNHYIMIRRLRLPAILLLVGVIALLDQTGVLHHFWHWFVPLLLILLGVLMLAERAALATAGGYPEGPYPGQPFPGPYQGTNVGPNAGSTQIVPSGATLEGAPQAPLAENSASVQAYNDGSRKDYEGGQS
jgi:hypothetical protein